MAPTTFSYFQLNLFLIKKISPQNPFALLFLTHIILAIDGVRRYKFKNSMAI